MSKILKILKENHNLHWKMNQSSLHNSQVVIGGHHGMVRKLFCFAYGQDGMVD